ncbi:MAG: DUF1295 domain-containing protein, partial [Chloroflexi bacterium]|nr:DUF1295 domain-containing protein [Chloroflexota bacterium]
MNILPTLGMAALTIFLYMTTMFLVALLVKRNDIADIAWGPGFLITGLVALLINGRATFRQILVLTLVAIWALRLAIHISQRNLRRPEDYRYRRWREEWGALFVPRTFLQVFMLQGLFMFLVSFPILIVMATDRGSLDWLSVLGALLWMVGFVFETVGDYQLDRFKADPANKGKIMTEGLWRYTRHPNYFGEVTQWWALS